jgi:branched-chain amino acid aminotransferase
MLWHDGTIISDSEPILSAKDRGISLGDGLFETLPCFNGHAFLKNAHIERMKNSAARLSLPFDQEAVEKAIDDLVGAHKDPGIIRVTLTRGEGQRGLAFPVPMEPHLLIVVRGFGLWRNASSHFNHSAQLHKPNIIAQNTFLSR